MSRTAALSALLLLCVACASAEDPALEKVRKLVEKSLPGIAAEDVQPSPVPGLFEVRKGSAYAYLTADGKYLIQGDLMDLESGRQLTEERRQESRLAVLKELGQDKMIGYGPKDAKYAVTVFTDIDCGYCRKLHREMDQYNARGIRVNYLFFPRSGPETPSFYKAEQVWCAPNREQALTAAKQGAEPKNTRSCKNPILQHYEAGEQLGINATPMIILPDGELVRGYMPASALAARLAGTGWDKIGAAEGAVN